LTEDQITALLEGEKVIGPQKDILEVHNAIEFYENLSQLKADTVDSFLAAHSLLMTGLVSDAGKFRKKGVRKVAGEQIAHLAPPAENVPYLMNDLFQFLNESEELTLIKSCVFHYELEFIHPFIDGNGRMGRLWQTLLLMKEYPVFEFIPFENMIQQSQKNYYQALVESDRQGNSTPFIRYMLNIIDASLTAVIAIRKHTVTSEDRISYFAETTKTPFTRKEYMNIFTDTSTATASRDLKLGVDLGLFEKVGDKTTTIYTIN
jgi:Fic family protein